MSDQLSAEPTSTTTIENQKSKIKNDPQPLLALHQLTLLLGDPGVGKSLLALDLAARISRNLGLPPDPPSLHVDLSHHPFIYPEDQPPIVILYSREDPEHIIKDRLIAAGAYLPHIEIFNSIPERPQPKSLRRDPNDIPTPFTPLINYLYSLHERRLNTRLLILDPLPAFLDRLDCTHPATIRQTLQPLLDACQSLGISLLAISHLNKSTRLKSPLQRVLGSTVYPALARSVYLLTPYPYPHPNPPTPLAASPCLPVAASAPPAPPPPTLLLLPLKSNYHTPTHAHPLSLLQSKIENQKSKMPSPPPSTPPTPLAASANSPHPSLYWHPPIPLSSLPPDLQFNPFAPAKLPDPYLKSKLEQAIEFLQTLLADGPIPSRQLQSQAAEIGITRGTLERARYLLQVKPHRNRQTHRWFSALPNQSPESSQDSNITHYADNI